MPKKTNKQPGAPAVVLQRMVRRRADKYSLSWVGRGAYRAAWRIMNGVFGVEDEAKIHKVAALIHEELTSAHTDDIMDAPGLKPLNGDARIVMGYEAMRIIMGLPTKQYRPTEVARWLEVMAESSNTDYATGGSYIEPKP